MTRGVLETKKTKSLKLNTFLRKKSTNVPFENTIQKANANNITGRQQIVVAAPLLTPLRYPSKYFNCFDRRTVDPRDTYVAGKSNVDRLSFKANHNWHRKQKSHFDIALENKKTRTSQGLRRGE